MTFPPKSNGTYGVGLNAGVGYLEAPTMPERVAVSIRYRGCWYYISDSDLNSKSTFNLLTYLFNLKAGSKTGRELLLTYPVR